VKPIVTSRSSAVVGLVFATALFGNVAQADCLAHRDGRPLESYAVFDGPPADQVQLAPAETRGKGKSERIIYLLSSAGETQYLICRYKGLPEKVQALPRGAKRCTAAGEPTTVTCR